MTPCDSKNPAKTADAESSSTTEAASAPTTGPNSGRGLPRIEIEDIPHRVWSKMDVSAGCWLWTASKNWGGYGQVSWKGKLELAHRLLYTTKAALPRGVLVRHVCDTPACVNPSHLITGTQLTNMADRKARGGYR